MAMKPSTNIWIQRQQCPCGDWKCFIKYDGDDYMSVSSQPANSKRLLSTEAVFTPYVGQIFKSDDDAFKHYSSFARKNGFSIRKARSTESQNLGIYRRDFVCYRSGFNQPRKKTNVEHHRERKSVRCGCDAKLYLTKEIVDGGAQWYVSQFSNIHNHELLEDDQVRLLPAYRKIQEADQERILLLSKAGFPVNRIVKALELEKGIQPGRLPFIEKDVRNFVRTCKKVVQENDALLNEKRENDMQELVEVCKAMIDRDPNFIYDYTTDENGKAENIAWSYGESIHAYTVFGDVVTLDTTYRSSTYGLLLGLLFGMDNNGHAILFGCVLLQDESSSAYGWALQTLVRFMRGRHPQTILTDIDPALGDAIAKELSETKHVIFTWHILSKISSWFSIPLGSQYVGFRADFDVLCHLESIENFEQQWDLFISRFGLTSDKHMALLFSFRESWPVAYIRSYFVARLLTDEFSQSLDSFLKGILNEQICLQGFFEQVSFVANSSRLTTERMHYTHVKPCMPIEEHARSILTPYSFNVMQNEILLSMQYAMTELSNGSYLLQHYKKMDVECLVIWVPDDEQIHCSCKEFEHSGILCRHSIRVLVGKNYFQLPLKYLLKRWRQESSVVPMDDGDQHPQSNDDECAQAFQSVATTLPTESLISKE